MKPHSIPSRVVSLTVAITFLFLDITRACSLPFSNEVPVQTQTLSAWSAFDREVLRELMERSGVAIGIADLWFSSEVSDPERLLNYIDRVVQLEYGKTAEGFDLTKVKPHLDDPKTLVLPYTKDKDTANEKKIKIYIKSMDLISEDDMVHYDYFIDGYAIKEIAAEEINFGQPQTHVQPRSMDGKFDKKYGGSSIDVWETIMGSQKLSELAEKGELTIKEYRMIDGRVSARTNLNDFNMLCDEEILVKNDKKGINGANMYGFSSKVLAARELVTSGRVITFIKEPNIRTGQNGFTWGEYATESKILAFLGLDRSAMGYEPHEPVSECWIASDDDKYPSMVDLGEAGTMSLKNILRYFPEYMLGEVHFKEYGPMLGSILKLIDARETLSIAVHPADGYPNRPPKPEMWKMLGKMSVYLGFKNEVTPEKLRKTVPAPDRDTVLILEKLKKDASLQKEVISNLGRLESPSVRDLLTENGKLSQGELDSLISFLDLDGGLEGLLNVAYYEQGDLVDVPAATIHAIRGRIGGGDNPNPQSSFVAEWSQSPVPTTTAVAIYDRGDGKRARPNKEDPEETIKVMEAARTEDFDPFAMMTPKTLSPVEIYPEDANGNSAFRLFESPVVIVEEMRIGIGGDKGMVVSDLRGRGYPIFIEDGMVEIRNSKGEIIGQLKKGQGAIIPAYTSQFVKIIAIGNSDAVVNRWFSPLPDEKQLILEDEAKTRKAVLTTKFSVGQEKVEIIKSLNRGFLIPHVERATEINLMVGRKLGLSEKELYLLEYASMYHDVGAGIRGEREEDFARLTNILKNAESGKSIKKAVEAIIEKNTPQGRTVLDLTSDERYKIFRSGMVKLLSQKPDEATEDMIFSLFDVAENSVRILKDKGIEMSPDLEMIVRYHNDYPGLIKNYDNIPGLTLSKERAALIVSILFMTDAFEHGNNYNTQVSQRKKARTENLYETFSWVEKQFKENDVTDRSPVDALKELLKEKDPGLLRVILASRKSDSFMLEDESFFRHLTAHGLVKDILLEKFFEDLTDRTIKFDMSINGGHEQHVISAFEDIFYENKGSFGAVKPKIDEAINDGQVNEVINIVKGFGESKVNVMRWALLLHDIGKSRGMDDKTPHPEVSEEIAGKIFFSESFDERAEAYGLGLKNYEKKLVLWLIKNHDVMGNIRTRERAPEYLFGQMEKINKDLEEDGVAMTYEELLDMLFIVTVCDTRGYTRNGELLPILSASMYSELRELKNEKRLREIQRDLFKERVGKWQKQNKNSGAKMNVDGFKTALGNDDLFKKIEEFFGKRITLLTNAWYLVKEFTSRELIEFSRVVTMSVDDKTTDVRIDFQRGLTYKEISDWLSFSSESDIFIGFEWVNEAKKQGRVFIKKKTDILKMENEDLLALMRPGNEELKRHMTADLKYAEVVARAAGYGDNEDFMNKLRVVSMSHDVGGVLGNTDDEVLERRLLRLAKENGIVYLHRDPADILNNFATVGVELTDEEKNFVKVMDHAENSVRILKANGVDIPKDVEFVIKNHMDALSEDELNALSQETLDLYLCLVVADVFEFGNNYYKHLDPYRGELKAFEEPERTFNFLKNIKFKDNAKAKAFFEKLNADGLGEAIAFSREERKISSPVVRVEVMDFKSERGAKTNMAVAVFSKDVETFPVFQPNIEKSWGMLRDKAPMHFKYKLAGSDLSDVDDLAPDYENARKDVWTVEKHLEKFQEDHPDMEIVGFVGNGNILANAHLVSYVDGRKYGTEPELERIYKGDSRVYPSLVMWKDGHFSVEDIKYLDDGKIMLPGTGRNIRDEVRFVNSGIGILRDGEPYDLAQNYEHDYDVRHYLDFPFIPGANVHFGVNLFYDVEGNPVRHLMQDAINEIPVTLPLEDKENRILAGKAQEVRTRLTPEQVNMLEENLINEKGYERVASREEVSYGQFFIDRVQGTITIGFMRGINPHNISCIDNNGNLVSVVVAGKSNRIGITFREAQEVLKNMGMKDAIIFDNGADVMMTMKGKTVVESFQKRDRITSLLIFARQKGKDENDGNEIGNEIVNRIKQAVKNVSVLGVKHDSDPENFSDWGSLDKLLDQIQGMQKVLNEKEGECRGLADTLAEYGKDEDGLSFIGSETSVYADDSVNFYGSIPVIQDLDAVIKSKFKAYILRELALRKYSMTVEKIKADLPAEGKRIAVQAPIENTTGLLTANVTVKDETGWEFKNREKWKSVSRIKFRDKDYNLTLRRGFYTGNHFVISKPELGEGVKNPQMISSSEELELFMKFLSVMGNSHEAFFNGAAPSAPSFHAQILERRMTIWDYWGDLSAWPVYAEKFEDADPSKVAEKVFEAVKDYEERFVPCDILFRVDGGLFKSIVIPRGQDPSKKSKGIGSGALEAGGFIPLKPEHGEIFVGGKKNENIDGYWEMLKEMSLTGQINRFSEKTGHKIVLNAHSTRKEVLGQMDKIFRYVNSGRELNSRRARIEEAGNYIAEHIRNEGGSAVDVDRKNSTAEMAEALKGLLGAVEKKYGESIVPKDIANTCDYVRENLDQLEADGMVAAIIVLARKAARMNQKLIIGLETEWIKGFGVAGNRQNDDINPIMREIRDLEATLRSIGIDNVVVVQSSADNLGREVRSAAESNATKLSNVVILASQTTVENKLKEINGNPKEMPFIAGVDGENLSKFYRENPGKEPVVDIISMLTLALELASGVTVRDPGKIKMIKGGIYDPSTRMVLFVIPEIKPVNPEDLKTEYLHKLEALIRA